MTLTVVKRNILANFAGSGWAAVLALILIPLYIKFLGIEAWGVIGIFTSLQSLSYLLDLGLSSTLNREMARLSLNHENAQEMRNLVRTFEIIYWVMAVAVGLSVFLLAPLIANRWLKSNQLAPETIARSIRMMGLAITIQWPFVLYSGGLLGLQRQVRLAWINVSVATLRGVGAVIILWQISATLQAFFFWQIVASILNTSLAAAFLWSSLPQTQSRTAFQKELLKHRWRFAAGVGGLTIVTLLLMQIDKVILSRTLSLEMFGYYVLASSVATSLYLLVLPVFYALYPRFTQLASLGDQEGLKQIYHHSSQLMAVFIIPITVTVVFYSRQILLVWTGNPVAVEHTYLVLSILIVSAAVHGVMHLPYAMQFAHGWTRLALSVNVASACVLTPVIVVVASRYGGVGAAVVLVTFNFLMALVIIQLMHRRILKGEKWRWYLSDVGLPLAAAMAGGLFCLLLVPRIGGRWQLFLLVLGVLAFTGGLTAVATPVTRDALLSYVRALRERVFNAS